MRKSIDTLLLILLLIGPSIVLTCVRQPAAADEEKEVTQLQKKSVSSELCQL